MKLRKLHLFLIMIFVIIASTLGFTLKEYFDNRRPSEIALDSLKEKKNTPQAKCCVIERCEIQSIFKYK